MRVESLLIHLQLPIRGTCFDSDGTASSSQAWLGAATLCTAMQKHSDSKRLSIRPGTWTCFGATGAYCQHLIALKVMTSYWKTAAGWMLQVEVMIVCLFWLIYIMENRLRWIFFWSYSPHNTFYSCSIFVKDVEFWHKIRPKMMLCCIMMLGWCKNTIIHSKILKK